MIQKLINLIPGSKKFWMKTAFVALFTLIFGCLLTFVAQAQPDTHSGESDQADNSTSNNDTTAWIDLYTYGFPNNVVWQLNIINHNCDSSDDSLGVEVQTSNETGTNKNYWVLGYFRPSNAPDASPESYSPTAYAFDSSNVGNTYVFHAPRDGIFNTADSTWIVEPIQIPGRYIRLKFTASDSKVWQTTYPYLFKD